MQDLNNQRFGKLTVLAFAGRSWETFSNFLEDMGSAPMGLTIERLNVNGDYEPGNCIWATEREQQRNKRNTVFVTVNGTRLPLITAAENAGIAPWLARCRLKRGWPVDRVLQP